MFTSWAAGKAPSLAILPRENNEQRKTHKFIPYAFGVVLMAASDLRWPEPDLTI